MEKRTILYTILFGTVFLVIFFIILAVVSFKKSDQPKHTNPNAICTSDECIRAAKTLRYSMDLSVDPCNDFYKYACGRWSEDNPNHGWWPTFNSYYLIRERVAMYSVDILTSNTSNLDAPAALNKSRDFYMSCMRAGPKTPTGFQSIKKYLEKLALPILPRILTGMHLENSNSTFDWIKSETLIKKLFMTDVFVGIMIKADIRRSSHNIMYLYTVKRKYNLLSQFKSRQELPVRVDPTVNLTHQQKSNILKKVFSEFLNLTQESVSTEELQNTVDILLNISDSIQKILNETSHDPPALLYFSLRKLQNQTNLLTKSVPTDFWYTYFSSLFQHPAIKVEPYTNSVYVLKSDFSNILKLLEYLYQIPDTHLELYVWWSIVKIIIPLTLPEIEKSALKLVNFTNNNSGTTAVSRSITCVTVVNEMMGYAVSYALVDKFFSNNKREKIEQMLAGIKKAHIDNLNNNEWMDYKTKELAVEKTNEMLSVIGYPDWLFERGKLDEYYSDVDIHPETYFDNIVNIMSNRNLQIINSLGKEKKRGSILFPLDVNAYNKPSENSINIPMAILNFPFYDLGLETLNYGSFGSILGHELTHGFDNKGRLFDKTGSFLSWWSNDTLATFKVLTECFINQYNNFKIDSIKKYINGTRTLNENLADNGGLNQAFIAYKNYVIKYGEEPKLPGFENFTSYQLFFLVHGNSRCETPTTSELEYVVDYDQHCPHSIRLLGTLQNSQDFADAFKCPVGSKMNPPKKCKLW